MALELQQATQFLSYWSKRENHFYYQLLKNRLATKTLMPYF